MCKAIDDLRAQAKAAGITEGRASGLAEGKTAGLAEGKAVGKMEALTELVKNRKISAMDAAQCAGISVEEFMKLCG